MTTITIDGRNEEDFRREVESDLRDGRDGAAVERLRGLLADHAGPGAVLPERFLTVTADDLSLRGWDFLGDCISRHDRPGRPVTALSIAFGWSGEEVPEVDEQGCLHPHVETAYFNDSAYPFSQSGRDDLLDGYSLHGCTWSADCEASDNALSVDGIDDLYGALAQLEARLLASEEPDEDEIRAGSLGACLLSALLFQAVGRKIKASGLPRPLCVTAGSNGVYPYFDAPVVGMPESARRAAAEAEEAEEDAAAQVPGPRYSSLLMTGIPRAQKRAVLVLAETDQEMAVRIARLRGTGEGSPEDTASPAPDSHQAEPVPVAAPVAPATAGGILAVKKPSAQNWDFRDMLGPPSDARQAPQTMAESDLPAPEPAPGPEDAFQGFDTAPQTAEDPAGDDQELPSPRFTISAGTEPVEPGFPLLASSLQERLESLLSPHVPLSLDAGCEPESEPEPEPEPAVIAQPWPAEQAGSPWPFGFNWDEASCADVVEPLAPRPEPVPVAVKPESGLWARLAAWIRPRR